MGERGKKTQSKEMKARKGNPGKRKAPKGEKGAFALSKLPAAPKHLSRIAGCEWRRVGGKYVELGKLTSTNLKALESYCMNYGFVREAQETIEKEGIVCTSGQGGHKMPHPAVGVMNKAQKEMREWLKVIENTKAQVVKTEKSALEQFRDRQKAIRRVK